MELRTVENHKYFVMFSSRMKCLIFVNSHFPKATQWFGTIAQAPSECFQLVILLCVSGTELMRMNSRCLQVYRRSSKTVQIELWGADIEVYFDLIRL